jgi:glutamyl/glutaminyl-tRNA synthetase
MNQQYILHLSHQKFQERLKPFVVKSGLMAAEEIEAKNSWFIKVCELMQPRLKVFSDIGKQGKYLFKDDFQYDTGALNKHLKKQAFDLINKFLPVMEATEPFEKKVIESALRSFTDSNNIKTKDMIHPLRVYITGQSGGPGLFDTMEVIGKERCLSRIKKILDKYGRLDD